MRIEPQPHGEAPAIAANQAIGHLRYVRVKDGEVPVIVIDYTQRHSEDGQEETCRGSITLQGNLAKSLARVANQATTLPAHPAVLLVPDQYLDEIKPEVEKAQELLQGLPGNPTIEFSKAA